MKKFSPLNPFSKLFITADDDKVLWRIIEKQLSAPKHPLQGGETLLTQ